MARIQYIRNGDTKQQGYLVGKSRGGTVLLGGNADTDGPISNVPNLTVLGAGRQANPTVPTGTAYARKAVNAGTWGVLKAGAYVVMGGNVTKTLAGVAYTGLQGGASGGYAQSIHYIKSRKTTRVTVVSWDFTTNTLSLTKTSSTDDFIVSGDGDDKAATPTRAVPGSLVFLVTGKTVTQHDYDAKTG